MRSPLWVNNCPRDELERGQLNPQQRTCDDCFGMSEKCRFCCKSRHTDGAGRLMPFVEAVRCHPLDCAGRLTLDFTDACNVTQSTQGRVAVVGRPTWQACEGSAQSLPT